MSTEAAPRALTIIVREPGRPSLRLSSPEYLYRAVQLRDITPETVVEVEIDGARTQMVAAQVPELAALFEALYPKVRQGKETSPSPPSDDTTNDLDDLDDWTRGKIDDDHQSEPDDIRMDEDAGAAANQAYGKAASLDEMPHDVGAWREARPTAPAENRAKHPSKKTNWFVLIAALLVLAAFGWISREAYVTATSKTWHATRELRVRSEPSAKNDQTRIGVLLRGAQVRGREAKAPEGRWLQVVRGPYKGAYISMVNLSETAPPPLQVQFHDEAPKPERVATVVLAEPSVTATVIGGERAGARHVRVGALESGWVEVLRTQGGVGYVPWSIFDDAPAASAQPALAAPPKTSSSQPPNAAPASVEPAPARRPPPRARRPAPETYYPPPPAAPPPVESAPAEPPPPYAMGPKIVRRPSQNHLNRYLPGPVLNGQEAFVTLDCEVNADLQLTDCGYSDEFPEGSKIGRAALSLARYYRLAPIDSEGFDVVGRRVTLNLTFRAAR